MPISEDELDNGNPPVLSRESNSTMSKAELRKVGVRCFIEI